MDHQPTLLRKKTPMDTRQPLDEKAIGLMLVLCLVWSLQQVVLKATAFDMAPIFQMGVRSGVAAVLVALLMFRRGEGPSRRDGTWRAGLVVGLLFGFEFLLIGEGLRHTSASHMVVFLYTAPIFAALGLHWRLAAERLGPAQWLGIMLAFAGVAIAFLGRSQNAAGSSLWGDFLGLMAGAAWGATTVVVRCTRLSSAPATQTLLYQLLGAFVILLGATMASGQTHFNPTPAIWASLAFQILIVSFASFLTWFWLLRTYLASRLGVFSFLTPLFGIVMGAVLLGEVIEPSFVLGSIPVLVGVVLVSGHGWLASLLARVSRKRKQVA